MWYFSGINRNADTGKKFNSQNMYIYKKVCRGEDYSKFVWHAVLKRNILGLVFTFWPFGWIEHLTTAFNLSVKFP